MASVKSVKSAETYSRLQQYSMLLDYYVCSLTADCLCVGVSLQCLMNLHWLIVGEGIAGVVLTNGDVIPQGSQD